MSGMETTDVFRRPMKDLRISVTDRCNYRCRYCMPLDQYIWIEKRELLTFEEIVRLARLFVDLGVGRIRITGGEPLVRRDLHRLLGDLSKIGGLKDLSLTTNGSFLARLAPALRRAGLRRINVSLDTLDPDKFRAITKRGRLEDVLEGVLAARDTGMAPIKINTVVIRGINDDEIMDLVEYSREHGLQARFIEYMDVGNANDWSLERTVTKQEILDRIRSRYPLEAVGREESRAPAVNYRFLDGAGQIGIIGSVTEPFCSTCSRVRLTADGQMVTCLFASGGHDLKRLLRGGSSDVEIRSFLERVWSVREDRFSDRRWQQIRTDGYHRKDHRKIEMITLGG